MRTGKLLEEMPGFAVVWAGQSVSLIGTSMANFALTIWAWQVTGKATALAFVWLVHIVPLVLLSPIGGALIDRWDRRWAMMLTDLGAGAATIGLLILYLAGVLQVWHVYVATFIAGAFQSLQYPAYSAAVANMLPKEHYQRANGLVGMAGSASNIIAPAIAGALMPLIGLLGVFLIDIGTFVFAISMLLLVRIPQPGRTRPRVPMRKALWSDTRSGLRYLFSHRSYVALLLYLFTSNALVVAFYGGLVSPAVLARTGTSELILGAVRMGAGIGGTIGGACIAVWGGVKRKIYGILGGSFLFALSIGTLFALGRGPAFWIASTIIASFAWQFTVASSFALWQSKVPLHMQGRVFANRRMISAGGQPFALLLVGILADRVFEPMMLAGGTATRLFGPLVGTGPGSGMALLVIIVALTLMGVVALGCMSSSLRNIEDLVPDHDEQLEENATSDEDV